MAWLGCTCDSPSNNSIDTRLHFPFCEYVQTMNKSALEREREVEKSKNRQAKVVKSPYTEMIKMTVYSDSGLNTRAVCMYLDSLIEAQNETNRLLSILIKDSDQI